MLPHSFQIILSVCVIVHGGRTIVLLDFPILLNVHTSYKIEKWSFIVDKICASYEQECIFWPWI